MKIDSETLKAMKKISHADGRLQEQNTIVKLLKARAKDLRMDGQLEMAYLIEDCVLEIRQLSLIPQTWDSQMVLIKASQR